MARQYSEKQVAEILSRAADLSTEGAAAPGTTLDDLERIAVEAGLDPAAVRRAAAEIDRGVPASSSTAKSVAGRPSAVVFETEMAGELSTAAHEQLAELLLRRFPEGQPSVVGRTFSWQFSRPADRRGGTDRVTLTVTTRDGRTTVRLEETYALMMRRTFGATMSATVAALFMGLPALVTHIGAGSVPAPVLVGGLTMAGLLGGFGIARTIFGKRAGRRQEEVQALFNEVCDVVSAAVAQPTAPAREEEPGLEAVRASLLGEAAPTSAVDATVTVDEAVPVGRR